MKTIIAFMLSALFIPVVAFGQVVEDEERFLFGDFTEGIVVLKNGSQSAAYFNYDKTNQKFLFMSDGQTLELANPYDVAFITIKGRFFEHINSDVFYERIPAGEDQNLYVLWRSRILNKGKKGAYGGSSQTSDIKTLSSINAGGRVVQLDTSEDIKVEPMNSYFIKVNNSFKSFNSQKSFVKIFKKETEKINQFIKDEKIDFSNLEDVKKLVEFSSKYNN